MRKPCCDNEGNNKGAWSKQEDQKLIDYIRVHGEGCWRSLPKAAGLLRCGKSCRLRWINYLKPDIKRGDFAPDEEDLIIKLHALLGNRWSLIAGRLPGRTDNEVKNYWNSHIRRKLIKMGIDPNNHKLHHSFPRPRPRVSAADSSSASMNKLPHRSETETMPLVNSCGAVPNDRVSDAESCLEEESTPTGSSKSHLNLDLNIAFPSPSSIVEDCKPIAKPNCSDESTGTRDMEICESAPNPNLLLFI